MVALVIGGAALIVLPGDDSDPSPPATVGSTTSVVETTTVPTTLLPDARRGQILVADPSVPAMQFGDNYIAYLADVVVGDGAGGIIVESLDRLIQISPSGESGHFLQASDIADDLGPVTIRLEDIAVVDGSPRVLYIVEGGDFLDRYEEVWWYDLTSGVSAPVYRMVAFESTITRVSQVGNVMVLSISFEGGTSFEYLDADGQRIEVAGPYQDLRGGAPDYPILIDQAVLSPDGTRLAYVEIEDFTTAEDGYLFADLVVWDLVGSSEMQRVEIELRDGARPGRLDYDGVGVVLGRYQSFIDERVQLTPLYLESLEGNPGITELDVVGTPSLVKVDLR